MVTQTEALPIRDRVYSDPRWFYEHVLQAQTYDKQIEIVESVRDNRRTAVATGNGLGKDWTAGRVILWWHATHYPAKTVVIGPTYRQVADIVFSEARSAYHGSRFPLGGKFLQTERWEIDGDNFAVGFSTDNAMNIQGYHSPNLLVIITEAHNVGQAHIEAAKRLNPKRLLLTGNPFATSGEFHAAFHEQSALYHTLQWGAFDSPNVIEGREVIPGLVTRQEVEERKQEWGEESALYVASILGRFPDNLEDAIVPRSLLMDAVSRETLPEGPATLTCDVARFGADKTVVYRVQGGVARQVWKIQGRDTQQVAGKLGLLASEDPDVDRIVVDDTGVGGGVTDRLREEAPKNASGKSIKIVAFNGGASAKQSKRFVNAVAEAWWTLADAFREGTIDIEHDPALIGQLSSRKYKIQGDRRIKLESKDDYKKRTGGSPDEADALAMEYSPTAVSPDLLFGWA